MSNRLASALSPYLRAHAENPVDWFPWGAEAFATAQQRDVPMLISIGYSTCHWCHVMARESFDDAETAAVINADFVAVKVDREEHPDVDAAYMAAASAFSENLGWPLTVFATPQGRVFFAGTYWPPVPRGPLPGFRGVLDAVTEAWTQRRAQAVASADAVTAALRRLSSGSGIAERASELGDGGEVAAAVPVSAIRAAAEAIAAREDPRHGGFGTGAKFPVAPVLQFLQTPLVRREAPVAASAATRAWSAMSASPLRDADGGFFRYATRSDWTVPHYERMLVDNAQLLDVAVSADDVDLARGIASFLLQVLHRDGGGFGAAQDSESLIDGIRNEGGYYLRPLADRTVLVPPTVDEKVVTGWNALAIGALARAGVRFGAQEWIDAAADAAAFVLSSNRGEDGSLRRASVGGVVTTAMATEADAGLLSDGLFALAAASGEAEWAVAGRELLDQAIAGGFGGDPLLALHDIASAPDQNDGDLPSGVSAVASAAWTAWSLGAGDRYREAAEERVRAAATRAAAEPFAHASLLRVAVRLAEGPRQVVLVDAPGAAAALVAAVREADADITSILTPEQAGAFAAAGFALFEGKGERPGYVYDCRSFVCRLPSNDPQGVPRARMGIRGA